MQKLLEEKQRHTEMKRELEKLGTSLARATDDRDTVQQAFDRATEELDRASEEINRQAERVAELDAQAAEATKVEAELRQLQLRYKSLRDDLNGLTHSVSWRLTQPLRDFRNIVRANGR